MTRWREGAGSAFRMGLEHGLLHRRLLGLDGSVFVAGIMNILWIAALSLLVGLETLVPRGLGLSSATGVILTAWGAWLIAGSFR